MYISERKIIWRAHTAHTHAHARIADKFSAFLGIRNFTPVYVAFVLKMEFFGLWLRFGSHRSMRKKKMLCSVCSHRHKMDNELQNSNIYTKNFGALISCCVFWTFEWWWTNCTVVRFCTLARTHAHRSFGGKQRHDQTSKIQNMFYFIDTPD